MKEIQKLIKERDFEELFPRLRKYFPSIDVPLNNSIGGDIGSKLKQVYRFLAEEDLLSPQFALKKYDHQLSQILQFLGSQSKRLDKYFEILSGTAIKDFEYTSIEYFQQHYPLEIYDEGVYQS